MSHPHPRDVTYTHIHTPYTYTRILTNTLWSRIPLLLLLPINITLKIDVERYVKKSNRITNKKTNWEAYEKEVKEELIRNYPDSARIEY